MRIEEDLKLGFKDVLIRPKRSTLKSRSDVELGREFTFKHSGMAWSGVPIIAANMDTVGTFAMAKALASFDILTAVHKHYSVADWQAFAERESDAVLKHVMVSTGTSDADFDKTRQILALNPALNFICIDVANGYSEHFSQFVTKAREAWPNKTICAGNVVTGEMCEELILCGADIVKVGIGPGSVCTTRVKTGVGYPQLSAVIECADAAHGLGGQIVSDGGCTVPGDVAKAFGGGADFVMLGGMLAGHDESGGTVVDENGA
ncbi:MAG: guanosine monophosphate reductase [Enterobacter kobei]|nr:guanosine monophosphate reductase [Enterobacter kobei]